METENNLESLQQMLRNPELRDDLEFINNFRSLAATVFFLEDCWEEEIEE